ncbi:Y-family DNA polymerase [Candidatus Marinimicrobia bacterium]|nr:Y-family DNA polymerase [Candidatus Neomarinimicrobiota bacterium]
MSSTRQDNYIAIIDCNNFYVSCERIFNPKIKEKPTVVLSNNDGCVIARSQEVKDLGVKMGTPIFLINHLVEMHNINVYSSNFALYGDISNRIMSIIKDDNPDAEIYSIDEAFISINSRYRNPKEYCLQLMEKIYQWTGIPVSIGIGKTKTLAKVANHLSKKKFINDSVCLIDDQNIDLLKTVKVQDIWGIGRRKNRFLKINGIYNAYDLKDANPKWIQKHMSIISRHTVDELNGIKKIEIDSDFITKKSISTSRSFNRNISDFKTIRSAISSHASRASEKLRAQNSFVNSIGVYLSTNRFRSDLPQYRRYVNVSLPMALNDTSGIIHACIEGLDKIFKKGFDYKKCGIVLTDLVHKDQVQESIFYKRRLNDEKISESIDVINKTFGPDTIRYAVQGRGNSRSIKREKLSPNYTTKWSDFLSVKI